MEGRLVPELPGFLDFGGRGADTEEKMDGRVTQMYDLKERFKEI